MRLPAAASLPLLVTPPCGPRRLDDVARWRLRGVGGVFLQPGILGFQFSNPLPSGGRHRLGDDLSHSVFREQSHHATFITDRLRRRNSNFRHTCDRSPILLRRSLAPCRRPSASYPRSTRPWHLPCPRSSVFRQRPRTARRARATASCPRPTGCAPARTRGPGPGRPQRSAR